MANNTGVYRQKINSKLPNNNSKFISANLIREVLAAGADAIDEIFETFSLADGLGTFNATTGVATNRQTGQTYNLTSVSVFDNGKYFDIVADGTQSIAGGSPIFMEIGGRVISRGSFYDYIPPSNLSMDYINTLNPNYSVVTTSKIQPSSTFSYEWYSTSDYPQINTWWVGKAVSKVINVIAHGFKRDTTANGPLTTGGTLKVFHRKAGTSVDTLVLNRTFTNAELLAFATPGLGTDYQNYFLSADLDSTITLELNDVLFSSLMIPGEVYPMLGSQNALLSTGEWNNGTGCWRASVVTAVNPTSIPAFPATNAKYNAVHFYYKDNALDLQRIKDIETKATNQSVDIVDVQNKTAKNPNKKVEAVGATNVTFVLPGGATARVVTSTGYDYKGTPDTLMIIFHGNGQTNTSGPSTTARAFLAANKISYAIVNVQDQTAEPFTTNATGWGNDIVLQRNMELYNYLMEKYNFHPSVILAGQSMGMLGVGRAVYNQMFPVRFVVSIGGVPDLVYMFNNGNATRKPTMRAAYGLPADGSQDVNFDLITKGKNWGTLGMFSNGTKEMKIFPKKLYMYVGTNDSTYTTDFGGDVNYNRILNAIREAGGFARYIKVAGTDHANNTIWDVAISDGVFFNEFGIVNSGTTAQRPTTLDLASAGYRYNDTTTGTAVTWNGSAWV